MTGRSIIQPGKRRHRLNQEIAVMEKSKNKKNSSGEYCIGIGAGSVSINCIVINQDKQIIYEAPYKRHMGRIEEAVSEIIREQYELLGRKSIRAVAFTGNHGKNISEKIGGLYEFETISQVKGSLFIMADGKGIIRMG